MSYLILNRDVDGSTWVKTCTEVELGTQQKKKNQKEHAKGLLIGS